MRKSYIGIDNGVSGSIGIITPSMAKFFLTPVINAQDYTKKKKNINRINVEEMYKIFRSVENGFAVLERPMVNPGRFTATTSALRSLEATLVILESLKIPYLFIDSKEWQKIMLPKGVVGSDKLKKASLDIGSRLFPQFKSIYKTDADGILIAEYARRAQL